MEESGATGDGGRGDEETKATFLVGEAQFAPPEPALGVLSGDRRQDFVGEVRAST